jgi:hypothetical protein
MKPLPLLLALGFAALASCTGCGQSEDSSTTNDAPGTQPAPSSTAAGLKEAAQGAAANVKETADRVGAEAAQQVDQLKAQSQGLIDKAKTLIAEKKYEDAWKALTQLSNFTLSPEQQKTVDDLKAQLQKVMSNPAVSNAVGNLLNR